MKKIINIKPSMAVAALGMATSMLLLTSCIGMAFTSSQTKKSSQTTTTSVSSSSQSQSSSASKTADGSTSKGRKTK
ncbi:MAG: hypothetical protein PUD36_03100 [Bacteroidales bacterium]|nr:hypothetical protein [Bacteroidales bacterium]